jgi:hypothetical protein
MTTLYSLQLHTVCTPTSSLPLLGSGFQQRTFPFLWASELSPCLSYQLLTATEHQRSHSPTNQFWLTPHSLTHSYLTTGPAYNISCMDPIENTVSLLLFMGRWLVTVVLQLLISRSLPSNGSACHTAATPISFLALHLCDVTWFSFCFFHLHVLVVVPYLVSWVLPYLSSLVPQQFRIYFIRRREGEGKGEEGWFPLNRSLDGVPHSIMGIRAGMWDILWNLARNFSNWN